MATLPKNISYFRLRLQELLNTSFPEKANNQKFIDERSLMAAHAYENAFRSGNDTEQCNEMANTILFAGLHFSKFDSVFEVVCREFDTIMADEELQPFAIKMFPVCEPVFSRYELTDDLAYGNEFELLYTELTGTIALLIEQYGL